MKLSELSSFIPKSVTQSNFSLVFDLPSVLILLIFHAKLQYLLRSQPLPLCKVMNFLIRKDL